MERISVAPLASLELYGYNAPAEDVIYNSSCACMANTARSLSQGLYDMKHAAE